MLHSEGKLPCTFGLQDKCAAFSVWSACSPLISYSRFWLMKVVWNVLSSNASHQTARKRFVQQPQQTTINITNGEQWNSLFCVWPDSAEDYSDFYSRNNVDAWGRPEQSATDCQSMKAVIRDSFHRCNSDLNTVWFLVGDMQRRVWAGFRFDCRCSNWVCDIKCSQESSNKTQQHGS